MQELTIPGTPSTDPGAPIPSGDKAPPSAAQVLKVAAGLPSSFADLLKHAGSTMTSAPSRLADRSILDLARSRPESTDTAPPDDSAAPIAADHVAKDVTADVTDSVTDDAAASTDAPIQRPDADDEAAHTVDDGDGQSPTDGAPEDDADQRPTEIADTGTAAVAASSRPATPAETTPGAANPAAAATATGLAAAQTGTDLPDRPI